MQYNYIKKRLKTDVGFRILQNLRSRLTMELKRNSKSDHTIKLLGCSVKFLKEYLEKQFKKNMNWNNYGRNKNNWQVDHKRPCCSFDLSKPSEQKKCFHYSNLQPLWIKENSAKRKFDNLYLK